MLEEKKTEIEKGPTMTHCAECGRELWSDLDPEGCNYCKMAKRYAAQAGTVYRPRD